MEIKKITNKNMKFYDLMGPFLAKREIEKEIGYQIYDDDGKTWIVALDPNVVGFCSRFEKGSHWVVGSCYVVPDRRNNGLFRKLLTEAIAGLNGPISITTKNETLRKIVVEKGFIEKAKRGSFTEYRRDADEKSSL